MTESTGDGRSGSQSVVDSSVVEALEVLRRRIRFRAWHRGTSEADLLLGSFVDRCINGLASDELHMVDRLLEEDDPVIEDWVQGRRTAPEEHDNDVLEAFKRFCLTPTLRGGKDEQRSRGD